MKFTFEWHFEYNFLFHNSEIFILLQHICVNWVITIRELKFVMYLFFLSYGMTHCEMALCQYHKLKWASLTVNSNDVHIGCSHITQKHCSVCLAQTPRERVQQVKFKCVSEYTYILRNNHIPADYINKWLCLLKQTHTPHIFRQFISIMKSYTKCHNMNQYQYHWQQI